MRISNNVTNNNNSFGHSFRVNICLKNENGIGETFISPSSNKKLYRELNSKIVGWLNEDYYTKIRELYGIERKKAKTEPTSNIHKNLVKELKKVDKDYARFGYVRSEYNGGRLAYIVTGVDTAIIENLKGIKNIGPAKADSKRYNGTTVSDYVKSLAKLVHDNIMDYVKSSDVLLRSKNDKEIMLRAIFKEVGTYKTGNKMYELDRFEFHENKTLATLPKINQGFIEYKYNHLMDNEIKKTVQRHVDRMKGKNK